jgi:hypothetical protein
MEDAAALRAETQRLRLLARLITDRAASAELVAMIEELERRTRLLDNGSREVRLLDLVGRSLARTFSQVA